MELMRANREWSTRPADERFSSLKDLHANALTARKNARSATRTLSEVTVATAGDDILLQDKATGLTARPTYSAFGQLAAIAKAPASYLRTLPATLAADCINNGLAPRAKDDAQFLFDAGDASALKLRAATSDSYARIFDCDITSRLVEIENMGRFQPAPAAFDGSRGLYRGDGSMFAFLVDNNRRIFERAPGGGFSRGVFFWNSEVGKASFGMMTFLYQFICGNHIVWEASNVKEIRLRHVGDVNDRAFRTFADKMLAYSDASATEDDAKLEKAWNFEVGKSKDEILDKLFGLRIPVLTKSTIQQAMLIADSSEHMYGNPRSAFALASGVTQIARDLPNADDRNALDRAGAKVMAIAF